MYCTYTCYHFFLAGLLSFIGASSFQFGAHSRINKGAEPTYLTRISCPNVYNIRSASPKSSSFSYKLYSSLQNDVDASSSLEEDLLPPKNLVWLEKRFNFSEEVLDRRLITLDSSVLDDRAKWLQKRLKLNDDELGSMIRGFPMILTYRPDTNLGPTLGYLQKRLELDTKTLSLILQKRPQILGSSVTQALEPRLNWIEKRLYLNETKALRKYVSSVPQMLTLSIDDNLEPTFKWLQERLNLNQTQLGRMVRKAPAILMLRVDSLDEKLCWLQKRLCLDDAVLQKIITRQPSIVYHKASTSIEPKLQWLQEQLFLAEDDDVGELVGKFPALLGMSIETNLEPTLDFFKECIGDEAAVELVVMFPRVLGASLEKRLKPRLEQAEKLRIQIDAGCLQRMAQRTEEKWLKSLDYQSKKLAKNKAKDVLW